MLCLHTAAEPRSHLLIQPVTDFQMHIIAAVPHNDMVDRFQHIAVNVLSRTVKKIIFQTLGAVFLA